MLVVLSTVSGTLGKPSMARIRRKTRVTLARDTATVEVDNPLHAPGSPRQVPRRITAMRSLRDDPLARLHDRRQIGEAEYRAGRDFQRLLEATELGRMRTNDPGREPVDGGAGFRDGLNEREVQAFRQLARLWPVLGKDGSALCRAFLGERQFLPAIAAARGLPADQATLRYLGRRLRECLETLAGELGYR
jgi:hypothetical protein